MYWRRSVTRVAAAIGSAAALSKVCISSGHCTPFQKLPRTKDPMKFVPFSYLPNLKPQKINYDSLQKIVSHVCLLCCRDHPPPYTLGMRMKNLVRSLTKVMWCTSWYIITAVVRESRLKRRSMYCYYKKHSQFTSMVTSNSYQLSADFQVFLCQPRQVPWSIILNRVGCRDERTSFEHSIL